MVPIGFHSNFLSYYKSQWVQSTRICKTSFYEFNRRQLIKIKKNIAGGVNAEVIFMFGRTIPLRGRKTSLVEAFVGLIVLTAFQYLQNY